MGEISQALLYMCPLLEICHRSLVFCRDTFLRKPLPKYAGYITVSLTVKNVVYKFFRSFSPE